MANPVRLERMVEDLVHGLAPVRPLPSPGRRAALWLGSVLLVGLILASRMRVGDLTDRMAVPDLALSALGAGLTAVAAAWAAFATAVPGRSASWVLLPLPPAVLWIGASGFGCLRGWIVPGTTIPDPHDVEFCLNFLVCVSAPFSALMIRMLARACPLRPNLTAMLGGLAVAAAAAVLLMPFHTYDAAALDLAAHALVLLGVVGLNRLLAGSLLTLRIR